MKNSSKRLSKILRSIGKFVDQEFNSLSESDKVKKSGELLIKFEFTKKTGNDIFVVIRLPEGVNGAIDSQGKLYDLNAIL